MNPMQGLGKAGEQGWPVREIVTFLQLLLRRHDSSSGSHLVKACVTSVLQF